MGGRTPTRGRPTHPHHSRPYYATMPVQFVPGRDGAEWAWGVAPCGRPSSWMYPLPFAIFSTNFDTMTLKGIAMNGSLQYNIIEKS